MGSKKPAAGETSSTVSRQREIQREQDSKQDSKGGKATGKGGNDKPDTRNTDTSERDRPEPPLPAQHLEKPGMESSMEPRPHFEAQGYKGSGKLEGKRALITGGDSGIGRAVAVLFAREGADVAIAYLCEDSDAEETARHVEKEGRRCLCIRGDVKDPAFCERAVQETVKGLGGLNILVNNAAFQQHVDDPLELSNEQFDETMRTNIYGYFYMAKAALPHLSEQDCIINTGSVVGLKGSGGLLDYSATKGAIHSFTMSLASNLAPKGIRVNAVAPGPVWTPLNPADQSAEEIRKFGSKTALGRPAQPDEISPAYVFLASPQCSSFITGIVLPITGSPG